MGKFSLCINFSFQKFENIDQNMQIFDMKYIYILICMCSNWFIKIKNI